MELDGNQAATQKHHPDHHHPGDALFHPTAGQQPPGIHRKHSERGRSQPHARDRGAGNVRARPGRKRLRKAVGSRRLLFHHRLRRTRLLPARSGRPRQEQGPRNPDPLARHPGRAPDGTGHGHARRRGRNRNRPPDHLQSRPRRLPEAGDRIHRHPAADHPGDDRARPQPDHGPSIRPAAPPSRCAKACSPSWANTPATRNWSSWSRSTWRTSPARATTKSPAAWESTCPTSSRWPRS